MAFLTMPAARHRSLAALVRSCVTAWVLLAFVLLRPVAAAPNPPSAEYQLKAVFLFNFAQFVEWPAGANRDRQGPLVIGVVGEDPFGTYLDELVKGELVGGQHLEVRRFARAEDISACHLLFISRSEAGALGAVFTRLKDRSVLTVSDVETFTREGGMVRFVMEGGKIRLRINLEAAKASGLTISSKLLRAATIVTAAKD